ncbi:hypothetical protein [Mangrovicoccus sp. HB161399]|uniref:hypothetical protein n=1 Tax=Mangrovicoccus sp. HB161399 TaxID=2720392 RepID=UPI001C131602|nr:hypothetical protein [Mangrovicoccus sp. HB161399]
MQDENKPAVAGMAELCLPPHLRKPRLRRDEAVEYLNLKHGIVRSVATLAKWAVMGIGPRFHKVNRTPLYPTTELDAWAEEALGDLRCSTSEG